MNIYLNCGIISLLGLALSILLIIRNLTAKAKLANVIFDWKLFWKSDAIFQIVGTLITVGIALMLLGPAFKSYPSLQQNTLMLLLIFATIGYVGSDIASKLFSVVNARINAAIDAKTTISDKTTGNLDAPTAAPKPQS